MTIQDKINQLRNCLSNSNDEGISSPDELESIQRVVEEANL